MAGRGRRDADADVERWLIGRGAPLMVRDQRRHPAFARALPFTVGYTVFAAVLLGLVVGAQALMSAGDGADGAPAADAPAGAEVLAVVVLAVVVLAQIGLPLLAAWLVLRAQRRSPLLRGRLTGYAVTAVLTAVNLGLSVVTYRALDLPFTASEVVGTGVAILVLVLLVRTGVAAVLRVTVGRVLGHLSDVFRLGTRAMPLLLVFVAFLMVNAENWQVAASLSAAETWALVAFFLGGALLFLLVRLPEELAAVRVRVTPRAVRDATARTPLEPRVTAMRDAELDGEPTPLRRAERANLVALLLARQTVQVVLLSAVMFGFFVVFGLLAVKPEVIDAWVGAPPTQAVVELLGVVPVPLPVPAELLRVSGLLAGFSGLYFSVFAVTDATYREQFFTRLLAEIEVTLLIREAYLRSADREPAEREESDDPTGPIPVPDVAPAP